jgi:hypothetical protein
MPKPDRDETMTYDPMRRARLDQQTPTEEAIRAAIAAVEAGPADERLTDAVIALTDALCSVADFVDGVPRRLPAPSSGRDA